MLQRGGGKGWAFETEVREMLLQDPGLLAVTSHNDSRTGGDGAENFLWPVVSMTS